MSPAMKITILILLSSSGFIDGFLLFTSGGPNHFPTWFNPFVGMLYLIVLPFWGNMLALFTDKETK